MQDTIGTRPSKWCGGCHDPAVLYAGKMDTPIKQFVHAPEAQAGLGCMMCHSIARVKSTMGQGDFYLEYPELHELAASKNPVVRRLHDFMTNLNPEPHRRVFLKPYQRDRLTSFIEPEADRQGSGYQVIQSKIAVGAGGIWGRGFAQGSQTHGMFLPVPQTDFIFAAFSEEHGFVGAMGVLLLYFMVLMRLIQNAQTAPDRAGTFLVMGVVAVIAFHILINVGMVVGFMPVTGIPLPLMSYGGSSVLFTFLALGIVMNIRMRRFVN